MQCKLESTDCMQFNRQMIAMTVAVPACLQSDLLFVVNRFQVDLVQRECLNCVSSHCVP